MRTLTTAPPLQAVRRSPQVGDMPIAVGLLLRRLLLDHERAPTLPPPVVVAVRRFGLVGHDDLCRASDDSRTSRETDRLERCQGGRRKHHGGAESGGDLFALSLKLIVYSFVVSMQNAQLTR